MTCTVQRVLILHPAVLICLWLDLNLLVQSFGNHLLMMFTGSLILLTLVICAPRFLILLRRTRWFLLAIFLIYTYTSQGVPIWPSLGLFSPGYEGFFAAIVQIERLLSLLALLSLLLTALSQSQLVAGLYTILFALQTLGISRERFAVRLALTLSYSDRELQEAEGGWHEKIERLLAPSTMSPGYIELQLMRLSLIDWLVIVASTVAIIGVLR